ncbi:MAG: T9SS type A sorting domain-containing protein [Cyclobacteriaceae bacterium]|nr:T9SS type A sorting domain-containing protein [Cyclobacteriaceae bacterium]
MLLTLVAIGTGVASAQAPCPSCQVSTDTQDPIPADRIKFWIYTPPGNNPNEPAPLLINLHGQGQIGDNINLLTTQATDATPAYLIANSQWPASRPFIVVSPQLKRDLSIPNIWDQDWPADYIDKVIEYVKTIRNINSTKIYIMGLSLGGQGCMIYSAAYPNKIAGMVPMCGRTDDVIEDGKACSLVNIPMWIFHGTEDLLLNYSNATNMAAAINACPNPGSIRPHVTLLDATEHNGMWNPIYNQSAGYPIYDWLLQFTKNSTANVPPYVNVGVDKKFLVSDGTLYLNSDFFDADGSITSIQWIQLQNPPAPTLTLEQTNTRILKITNLQAGTFQFRLTVTDNLGAVSSDDITIELLSTPESHNSISSFRLTNAANNNSDISSLVNEQVINKNILGTNDLNVRAIITTGGGRVQFRVNSNQYTRVLSGWFINELYVYPNAYWPYGWKILPGDHVLCTTPFTGDIGPGVDGISKCVKFSVVTQTMQNYYPKPGQDLSQLSSWGTDPVTGNGTSPGSFSGNFQVFNVNKAASQNGTLTISGTESALWVKNGGEMTVNNNFTGVINIEGNGVVNVNTSQAVTFGSVSTTSTVRFGAAVTSIPASTYGHVEILGAGTTKTLGSGATIITGNLIIGNDVTVNGAANNTSNIQLTGNLTLLEDSEFNPVTKFGLTLSAGQPHAINLSGTKAVFNQLTILGNSVVSITQGTLPKTLELGSTTGGGLIVHAGSELGLGKNHLTIIGSGTINPQNQTGRIAFDNSNLSVTSSSSSNSYLYTKPLVDHVSAVTANLTGAGALILQDSLFVVESVKMLNGTLNANGFLTLVSTADQTARIERVEGTGDITGDVRFQRYVRPGRMYRYLSFPVQGATVGDLQKRVPVTGNFDGRSTGPGLTTNPSLFYYTEPGGWLPYPTTTSAAEFSMGRGYAVFVRKADDPTTITVAGEVHTGDFPFQLNAGSALPNAGWSLIGNPYASPIQWGGAGWISTGINETVSIRDNEYAGENGYRFLKWDGEVGDLEFFGLIAQGQAFWVKATDPLITPSLTVQETAKSTEQATMFRTKEEPRSSLTISLNHNGLIDRTFLKFNNRSGLMFDPHRDGVKQQNSYYNFATLTPDSVLVAIKNMPDTCTAGVTLSVQHTKPGTYSLEFSGPALESEREFVLQDNYLGVNVRVTSNQRYSFQITDDPNTFGHKRFQLLATVELPLPEISVEQDHLVSSVTADIQWLLNGEEIAGATQSTYTPLISGNYQVRVTKSSCSKTSPPFAYVITGTEPRQPAFHLYPNPAEYSVSVEGILKPTPYTLLNSWGQVVQTGLLTADHSEIELAFSSGLYILALEGETGIQRHKLIIKK